MAIESSYTLYCDGTDCDSAKSGPNKNALIKEASALGWRHVNIQPISDSHSLMDEESVELCDSCARKFFPNLAIFLPKEING